MAHLLHGVLYGGACEEEPVAAGEAEEGAPADAAAAFDGLRLVQDHVLPLDTLEVLDVLDHLEGGGGIM